MAQPVGIREFKRGLGLFDATMVVAGVMIGSGIFIVSADIGRTVGAAGPLLLVWVITGLISLAGALGYGELAGMLPHVGGQYVYLREAYNPLVGFLYGWTLFLVIQTGTIAAVAVAFAKFTGVLIPWYGEQHILLEVGSFTISAAQMLAIAILVLLTVVNIRGLQEGKTVQNIFTLTKIASLAALVILGLLIARNPDVLAANLQSFWNASWTHMDGGKIVSVEALGGWKLLAAMGVAMVGSLFAAEAWHTIAFTSGEVVNPKRNLPLSLVLGVGLVIVLYVLVNVSYVATLPVTGSPDATDVAGRGIQFATSDRVATAAASTYFGTLAETIMAILVMISTFGCINGLILVGARAYYAMSQDHLFFRSAGTLSRRGVPAVALWLQLVWASLLCLSGTYGDLLDYVVFAVLVFYALTIVGLFILRKKRPDAERPYKAWGYPIVPAMYVILTSGIGLDLLVFKPRRTWPGAIIVLLGIPVYYVWKEWGKRKQRVSE
jgi:APA family basic amino acid/polyamine antiporter